MPLQPSESACRQIVAKAFGSLEPGGVAVIHEFILNDDMDGPLFPALFSLNMLLGTEGGRAYSQAQLADMLMAAGFQVLLFWIKGVVGQSPGSLTYWLPTLTSTLLWPPLFLLLRHLRIRFRVA